LSTVSTDSRMGREKIVEDRSIMRVSVGSFSC
jgi:hypothetical protein